MAQAILTAAGIRKAYGPPVVALDGVTFSAEAGKITCLLGDNGAAQHGEIVVGEDVETGHHIHQFPDVLDQAVAEHQRFAVLVLAQAFADTLARLAEAPVEIALGIVETGPDLLLNIPLDALGLTLGPDRQ